MARGRLYDSPKNEAASHGLNLLRELFNVVKMMFAKSSHLFSGMISVIFLALTSALSCALTHEHMDLKYFPMESRL